MKSIFYFFLSSLFIYETFGSLTRMRLQQKTREELSKDGKETFDKHLKSMEKLNKLNDKLEGKKHSKDDKDEIIKPSKFGNSELYQGDMILSPSHAEMLINEAKIKLEAKNQGKNATDKSVVDKLKKNRAYRKNNTKWKFPIPYFVDGVDSNTVDRAIKDIEANTCVRFKKEGKFSGKSGLRYFKGSGCSSTVGQTDGRVQDVSIGRGCEVLGIVQHETLHALGFYHEQARPDRDQYLTIAINNVHEKRRRNYRINGVNEADTYGIPYNYGSAMHYDKMAFTNTFDPVMITKNKLYQDVIGNAGRLAFLDFKMVNTVYCKDKCKGGVKCSNGGYEDPNKCGTCKCPYLLTGNTCTDYIKNPPACGNQNVIKLSGKPTTVKPKGKVECVYAVSSPKKVKLTFGNSNLKFNRGGGLCWPTDGIEVQYLNDKALVGVTYCDNPKGKSITSEGNLMLVKYSGNDNSQSAELTFTTA
uniref:Zinc metalloproteinase n=1 Tax=Parastrongyloides trichosuri TaxID=131310 RepID=A0A0N4Z1H0_PARTI